MDRRVVAQLLDSIDSLVPNTLTKARNPTTATGTKNANTTNTASNARDLLVLSEAVNGEANNGRLDVSGEEEETVSSKKITDNIVIFIAATNRLLINNDFHYYDYNCIIFMYYVTCDKQDLTPWIPLLEAASTES